MNFNSISHFSLPPIKVVKQEAVETTGKVLSEKSNITGLQDCIDAFELNTPINELGKLLMDRLELFSQQKEPSSFASQISEATKSLKDLVEKNQSAIDDLKKNTEVHGWHHQAEHDPTWKKEKGENFDQLRLQIKNAMGNLVALIIQDLSGQKGKFSNVGTPGYKSDIDLSYKPESADGNFSYSSARLIFNSIFTNQFGSLPEKLLDLEVYVSHPGNSLHTNSALKSDQGKKAFIQEQIQSTFVKLMHLASSNKLSSSDTNSSIIQRVKASLLNAVSGYKHTSQGLKKMFADVEAFHSDMKQLRALTLADKKEGSYEHALADAGFRDGLIYTIYSKQIQPLQVKIDELEKIQKQLSEENSPLQRGELLRSLSTASGLSESHSPLGSSLLSSANSILANTISQPGTPNRLATYRSSIPRSYSSVTAWVMGSQATPKSMGLKSPFNDHDQVMPKNDFSKEDYDSATPRSNLSSNKSKGQRVRFNEFFDKAPEVEGHKRDDRAARLTKIESSSGHHLRSQQSSFSHSDAETEGSTEHYEISENDELNDVSEIESTTSYGADGEPEADSPTYFDDQPGEIAADSSRIGGVSKLQTQETSNSQFFSDADDLLQQEIDNLRIQQALFASITESLTLEGYNSQGAFRDVVTNFSGQTNTTAARAAHNDLDAARIMGLPLPLNVALDSDLKAETRDSSSVTLLASAAENFFFLFAHIDDSLQSGDEIGKSVMKQSKYNARFVSRMVSLYEAMKSRQEEEERPNVKNLEFMEGKIQTYKELLNQANSLEKIKRESYLPRDIFLDKLREWQIFPEVEVFDNVAKSLPDMRPPTVDELLDLAQSPQQITLKDPQGLKVIKNQYAVKQDAKTSVDAHRSILERLTVYPGPLAIREVSLGNIKIPTLIWSSEEDRDNANRQKIIEDCNNWALAYAGMDPRLIDLSMMNEEELRKHNLALDKDHTVESVLSKIGVTGKTKKAEIFQKATTIALGKNNLTSRDDVQNWQGRLLESFGEMMQLYTEEYKVYGSVFTSDITDENKDLGKRESNDTKKVRKPDLVKAFNAISEVQPGIKAL